MTISPERLRELIEDFLVMVAGAIDEEANPKSLACMGDTLIALRELEQARTTLEGVAKGTHVIVPREHMLCDGSVCSCGWCPALSASDSKEG